MTIDFIKLQSPPITRPESIIKPQAPQGAKEGENFSEMFSDALKEVDQLQTSADKQIEGMLLGGEDAVSPHEAMIALEKADTAFTLMNNIRAKIIRAYEDVLRTQV